MALSLSREFEIPAAYTDDAQLYAHQELDVVSICTPDRLHAEQALDEGWEFAAPETAVWVSAALWLLMLEAVRRTAGWVLFVLVTLFLPRGIAGLLSRRRTKKTKDAPHPTQGDSA